MKTGILAAAAVLALAGKSPLAAQAAAPAAAAAAAQGISEADLAMLRADLRESKRQITFAALELDAAQTAAFTPVYDRYIGELTAINNGKYALIKEYTERYGKYSDAQAIETIKRWLDVDVKADKLRAKYVGPVSKVLPGVKAATFFQVDRRLSMLINLQLASQLPLLDGQSHIAK